MRLPRKIRNFNAFLDGVSYAGLATEAKLPQVKLQTEAHRGAGMDGPVGIDMGMEGMTAELTLAEWSPAVPKLTGTVARLVLRPGVSTSDIEAGTIIASIGGLVTGVETGDLKPGADAPLKLAMDVRSYKLEIDGQLIWDIDLVTGKRIVGGADQLAAMRRAMGI